MKIVIDDGGRAAAGFKGLAGDCAVRAIAIAARLSYADVYRDISEINRGQRKSKRMRGKCVGSLSANYGVYTTTVAFKRYMRSLGFTWTPTMRIGTGCKVHLRSEELPSGRLVVSLSHHLAAVIDGELHDIGDCTRGGTRCVYGYWKL